MDFCDLYELIPLPATITTMCLYVTYLMKTVCYVTITNYVSSVWVLHDYHGVPHIDPDTYLCQSTMKGAKRILGNASRQVDPLMPWDMMSIYKTLNMSNWDDFRFWCAMCVCYRCLLRVSHVTTSPHTLRVRDVKFWLGGMDISVHSSKTIQFKERVQCIPIIQSTGSVLCPVRSLRHYITMSGLSGMDRLFPYTYKIFSTRLHLACTKAGLVGDFATHSLRRGSASFLATFLPLHEVKQYGDWKSWSVLLYISDNYQSRIRKDVEVARRWRDFY